MRCAGRTYQIAVMSFARYRLASTVTFCPTWIAAPPPSLRTSFVNVAMAVVLARFFSAELRGGARASNSGGARGNQQTSCLLAAGFRARLSDMSTRSAASAASAASGSTRKRRSAAAASTESPAERRTTRN